jgi:RNA polymerase sigma factor (sigma-70 family)
LTTTAAHEGRSSKQTWAFAIARRCAYTWLAQQKREPEQIGAPAIAVDDASRTERRMLLVEGLARLSALHRDVLRSHLTHGNHEDVARELGISVPAAKMRYARAKEALKDVLTRTRRD